MAKATEVQWVRGTGLVSKRKSLCPTLMLGHKAFPALVTPHARVSAVLCAEGAGSPGSSFRLHVGACLQILGERGLTLVMKRLQRGRGHRESLPAPCPGQSSALSSSVLPVAVKVSPVSAVPALQATHQPALCLPQPG